jgi:hypothetical protein
MCYISGKSNSDVPNAMYHQLVPNPSTATVYYPSNLHAVSSPVPPNIPNNPYGFIQYHHNAAIQPHPHRGNIGNFAGSARLSYSFQTSEQQRGTSAYPPTHININPNLHNDDAVTISSTSNVTSKKSISQGNCYDEIESVVLMANSFEAAIKNFSSLYGCKVTKKPAQLLRVPNMSVQRQYSTKHEMIFYYCTCTNPINTFSVSSRIRLVDSSTGVNDRRFEFHLPSQFSKNFNNHFYLFEEFDIGNDLPEFVKNRVISILQTDPMATDLYILLQILSCPQNNSADGNPFLIRRWLFDEVIGHHPQHGNQKLDTLMSYISKKASDSVEAFNPF